MRNSPDERRVHDGCNNADSNGLLFLGLSTRAAAPPEDQGVNTVRSNSEDDHRSVASAHVHRQTCGYESNCCNCLGDGNVPRALVEFTAAPRDGDCDGAGNQVWWACEDEGNSFIES